ncbi:helix-turn-helix transcriptional regulator [Pseudomonas sp. SZMC_28357]|uniref:helix-turn-helix domain-containing protein n=1 Tax=Pseudomonas sp. SZMC_28357 TaxID=3074380 RepID=UPI00287229BD|nr:helix-turn-helix transcriptional regulator [Pseudomonas sp. SZMC_28357]MDR9750081.1 helix-turn-helix transcriptional regulator [Pseudomonas sp. SZMC_28357]
MSQSTPPHPSPSEVFPNRLRTAREYRGLNQAELAKNAGMQPSAISHFETGTRKPSFDNLRILADSLDVTTDYLLGRVEEFKDLAGADRLHRHYESLDGSDRKMADDLITMLAKRAQEKDKQ